MKHSIRILFEAEYPRIRIDELQSIAAMWENNRRLRHAIRDIERIERGYGPTGIWSAKYTRRTFSFSYLTRYDDIFRPLKYVYMKLLSPYHIRTAETRDIVFYATAHIESCLKEVCQTMGMHPVQYEKRPIGSLTRICDQFLPAALNYSLQQLSKDADYVSAAWQDEIENQWKDFVNPANDAKHAYGDIPRSLFQPDDTIAVYLCVRKLGYEILTHVGLETDIENEFQNGGPFTDFTISL